MLLSNSGVRRNPVHFPSFPAVVGKGLFEAARGWSDIGNDEANQNRFAVERFLVVELASSILEFADRRLGQAAAADAGEVEAPLAGLGVVQTQAQGLDAASRTIDHQLHQVGSPTPDAPNDAGSVVLDPSRRTGKRALEAP